MTDQNGKQNHKICRKKRELKGGVFQIANCIRPGRRKLHVICIFENAFCKKCGLAMPAFREEPPSEP
jgi:hypothetical protein